MGTMLRHLVLLLLAAIWPAFAFPRAALNRRVRTPELHARDTESNDNIPRMEGFNITLSPKNYRPILVKSFDRQATSTLTTTLTISDHATAFTIKPSDVAVKAATFTTTSSGHTMTYMCYPTLATAAGTTNTKCIKDTKTTLGVIDIGSVTVTPNPTGFAVGSQTLTPGGLVTVGTHTLSLGPSGGLMIDGSSTHIDSPTTATQHGGASSTAVTTPTSKHTPATKASTRTHKTSTKTSTKSSSTTPTTRTTKTTTASTRPSNTSTKPSTSSTKHTTTSTKRTTPSTKPTPKPSHTDEILTIGSLTVTADPTGFQIGSKTLTPGGMITVGTQTVSLETGGGDVIIGGTTVPLTATTGTSSTQSWTTLSDESTTGLYGIITLPGFESLTTPTIITTQYIESKTKTTTGPIYVGTGGIVLQSWPPSTDNDHSGGGGLIIPDPIRPAISNPKLKCPAILKWLCGSDHTSSTDNGSDVDPDDKPNSNPKDDPNNDDNPTTEPTSTHTSTTSQKSTTTTSTCTKTKTVTDCDIKCSPTVMSGKSTTTTTCFTTSCSTVEGCSATGTTSTTIITSEPCGTGTASACPTFTDGTGWVYPDTTIDTAAVNKLASSIMSEDDSILAAFSSAFSQTGVITTPTTLATTTSSTRSSAITRTTSHTASSTGMTTTKTTKTSKTSTATTTSALSCIHQYDSQSDQDNCYCEGHTGLYQTMSSTSGMTNYQPCAWTTLPPVYSAVNVGPITSTLSDGDVVYCTSAHWAENGGSSKYCLGSVSTISTASHTTTTTTSSSTTSTGVSATGTGSPTGEMYIGIVTEGYTFTWNVYIPTVGTIPNWCDDSMGSMSASGDTTRYYYPPDIKFQDLDGKAKEYPCVYTGDKNTVGKLSCEGMGEVPCTGDFAESDAAPLCTNSLLYAGSAFPRVYCKWYGSDGDA